jgi:PST family polysaccharide transporter
MSLKPQQLFNSQYWKNLFFSSPARKRLVENFVSLATLQGLNYILPLITLPYLVRVLGPEKYGLVSFAQAFIAYFGIITDYGFNLSATREISVQRENPEKISQIFSSVITIKAVLLVVSFFIMSAVVFTFQKFRQEWLLYYLSFGTVLGQVVFPVWFFQGMERMKYITYINIITKTIFTVLIFVFVHKMSDYILIPLLTSLGAVISGSLSFLIIFKNFGVHFQIPAWISVKHQLKEGWHIFISTVAISLYTVSNTFILGLFTNNTIVGYYSGAEKIIRAVQGMTGTAFQTIYPYISKLASESKQKAILFIRKITFLLGGASLILSLIIFILAPVIVRVLLGNQYAPSVTIVKILSFIPFITGLSNAFGNQTMLTFNYKKAFSNIYITASIINILLAFILVPLYKHLGIATCVVITETFVTASMFLYLQNQGVKIIKGKYVFKN